MTMFKTLNDVELLVNNFIKERPEALEFAYFIQSMVDNYNKIFYYLNQDDINVYSTRIYLMIVKLIEDYKRRS